MMEQRQTPVYPNLTDLIYQQNIDRLSIGDDEKFGEGFVESDRFGESVDTPTSPVSLEEDSSSPFGVDLTGKGTNLGGKSFTIAAILGLTNSDEDVMNLSVQERLQQNQRQLQNYLYAGHDMQRLNEGFCRTMGVPSALRQDSPRPDLRQQVGQLKSRTHPVTCSSGIRKNTCTNLHHCHTSTTHVHYHKLNNRFAPQLKHHQEIESTIISQSLLNLIHRAGRSKRIRTIFTPEQLERLEAEFERQQYMVGPERLYLAHALQLTEAQVKVWFQNRRIKWRKHHLEVTQQRLAVLQRHRPEERDDV